MSQGRSRAYPDMWVDPDEDPRDTGGPPEGERATLLDHLRAHRLTLEMKCDHLTPEQLATRSVPPSTLSLLGLVRHLAKVERDWFRIRAAGEDVPRLYWTEANRDEAFTDAVGTQECVDEAFATWRSEVAFAERFVDAEADLGRVYTYRGDQSISLRELLVHLVEEYARHCGHADLLRECIDGRTGE